MSVLENLKKKLHEIAFGARHFDTELNVILIAPKDYGKSAIRDAFLEATMDPQAPRMARGISINPHDEMKAGQRGGYARPTPVDVKPFDGAINIGGRHLILNFVDPAGEMIDAPFEDEPADVPKKEFAEALKKADLVVVLLPVGEVLGRTTKDLEPTLRNLAALAVRAIEARRKAGRLCSVAIVYTKADEVGVATVGASRLVGDGPGGRLALQALQAAPLKEAVARLNEFTQAASVDPQGSPEWSQLRGELLDRTSVLWDILARCQSLDTRSLNGYVIAAKPVERDESRRTTWAERGVLHVFRDFFEEVRERNATPGLRWWMLAGGAVAAMLLLAAGLNASRRAEAIASFNELNRDGPDRREASSTPRGLVPLEKWTEIRRPFLGRDDVPEATFLAFLHQRYAELGSRLRVLAAQPAANLGAATKRVEDAVAARMACLDRQALWNALTPSERAEIDQRPELRRLLDDMRDIQVLFEETERAMVALLAVAPRRLDEARKGTVPERMDRLRNLEADRSALQSRLDLLVKHPRSASEFFAFSGTPPRAKPSSVGADLLNPFAAISGDALKQVRLESKKVLSGASDYSEDWWKWHVRCTAEEVAFLKGIDPDANLDPLSREFYPQPTRDKPRMVQFGPRRTMVVLRVRDANTRRMYDLDLSRPAVHEVKDGRADADSDEASPSSEGFNSSRFDIVSVHVMPGQPPLTDGYRTLDIEARGRKSGFWLPAFLAALDTPALKIGGLTDDMRPEWEAFKKQMKGERP